MGWCFVYVIRWVCVDEFNVMSFISCNDMSFDVMRFVWCNDMSLCEWDLFDVMIWVFCNEMSLM